MRIFCDLHHRDLYYSLRLLLEKRLGFEMYRPIGLEWYQQGFWKVFDHPATANQYLALNGTQDPSDEDLVRCFHRYDLQNVDYKIEDGVYYIKDASHQSVERGVTLKQFKNMKFDLLIASIPSHVQPFKELISHFQPNAKLIFQIGNPIHFEGWGSSLLDVKNIMSSTLPFSIPGRKNIVFYNQEFDLDIYKWKPPTSQARVNSYNHNMEAPGPGIFQKIGNSLNWDYHMYGGGMSESLFGAQKVAQAMIDSGWTFHYKPRGDGYGHVLHSTYACGRPAIIDASCYRGMAGGRLLEDKVTCIDFSKRSLAHTVQEIRYFSQPDRHLEMCRRAYNRFKSVVNFDQDESKVRKFLERVI